MIEAGGGRGGQKWGDLTLCMRAQARKSLSRLLRSRGAEGLINAACLVLFFSYVVFFCFAWVRQPSVIAQLSPIAESFKPHSHFLLCTPTTDTKAVDTDRDVRYVLDNVPDGVYPALRRVQVGTAAPALPTSPTPTAPPTERSPRNLSCD